VIAVRAAEHQIDVDVQERFTRYLPARPPRGWWKRLWWRAPTPAPLSPKTFSVSPPPMATDSYSHPVFVRLAGEVPLNAIQVGQRVFVVEAMFVCLLHDDAATREQVLAAFDRSGDVAWAAGASADELHLALVHHARWDAALEELRWRDQLDPARLAAQLPAERLGGLQGVIGRFAPDERRAFFVGAAERLRDDRPALTLLARSLCDFVQLIELEPLILLLDGKNPDEAALFEFARVRVGMILGETPARRAELSRLAAHVGHK
jgi:hypothetical protein